MLVTVPCSDATVNVGEEEDWPVPAPDSVQVGIRHLERLYLELGSLRVQLEDGSLDRGAGNEAEVESVEVPD